MLFGSDRSPRRRNVCVFEVPSEVIYRNGIHHVSIRILDIWIFVFVLFSLHQAPGHSLYKSEPEFCIRKLVNEDQELGVT